MSFNSSLNPNVVKTALDGVFNQTFSGQSQPNRVSAESGSVFKQDTADSSAVIMELFKGVGAWEQRAEEADVPSSDPRIGNQKTFTVVSYDKSVDIPKHFFDDNKHGSYENMVQNFALRARTTRDKNAFAQYKLAFTTALTSDGAAIVSDTHTNLNGNTVDNKITSALSESSLNDAIVALAEMKSQDGEIDGFMPSTLLVPMKLYKKAAEILESELRSNTANNDTNIYSSKYGISLGTTPYLGLAAGGSDTAWFLLAENHSMTRWVRTPIFTDLVDYKFQRNNVYIYKGEYREVTGCMTFEGLLGSDGTA